MQGYNLILVYNSTFEKIILCQRVKEPYLGLSNLPGGKIEPGESSLLAAYRELEEETGIQASQIKLHHLMDFTYHMQNCYVEVYVGRLKSEVILIDEIHPLYWSDLTPNFFDQTLYAGEGNIGHIIEQANFVKERLLS